MCNKHKWLVGPAHQCTHPTANTGQMGHWGEQLMREKCFEAEKQEVLSIISHFSVSLQQLLKLGINTIYN